MHMSPTIKSLATANPAAADLRYIPCVPIAVSASLVAAQALAKKLETLVSMNSPELVSISPIDFANIQLKKSELRLKVDECAVTDKALLDVCLLNMKDLFTHLAAYLIAHGRIAEFGANEHFLSNMQSSLKLVHDYAASMHLCVADYCVDGIIFPEMLFETCLKRLQFFQKRWQENYFQSIELALKLQRDSVYGAAASCLTEICQHGLDSQITLEPMPQAQEDVLVALATFVDLPYSGEWPVLREKIIVSANLENASQTDNKSAEGGLQ